LRSKKQYDANSEKHYSLYSEETAQPSRQNPEARFVFPRDSKLAIEEHEKEWRNERVSI